MKFRIFEKRQQSYTYYNFFDNESDNYRRGLFKNISFEDDDIIEYHLGERYFFENALVYQGDIFVNPTGVWFVRNDCEYYEWIIEKVYNPTPNISKMLSGVYMYDISIGNLNENTDILYDEEQLCKSYKEYINKYHPELIK